jgi:hypothetical protein
MSRCAALFALSVALLSACAIGEGVTPTCEADLDSNGNLHKEGGCNPFAVCLNSQGQQANPDTEPLCCGDIDPGCSHDECLFGYGVEIDLTTSCGKGGGSGGAGSGGAGGGN